MTTLQKLGLGGALDPLLRPEDQSLYEWLLCNLKLKNYGVEVLTYGLVNDLKGLLHLKRSKHEEVPRNKLSRHQLCHLIIHLVSHMRIDDVTKSFENGVFKQLASYLRGIALRSCVTQN